MNAQDGRLILLLTCKIRLHLSKIVSYSKQGLLGPQKRWSAGQVSLYCNLIRPKSAIHTSPPPRHSVGSSSMGISCAACQNVSVEVMFKRRHRKLGVMPPRGPRDQGADCMVPVSLIPVSVITSHVLATHPLIFQGFLSIPAGANLQTLMIHCLWWGRCFKFSRDYA